MSPKFRVTLASVDAQGNETPICTNDVESLQQGEDVAQQHLNVYACAFEQGLEIVTLPESRDTNGGARVYDAPSEQA